MRPSVRPLRATAVVATAVTALAVLLTGQGSAAVPVEAPVVAARAVLGPVVPATLPSVAAPALTGPATTSRGDRLPGPLVRPVAPAPVEVPVAAPAAAPAAPLAAAPAAPAAPSTCSGEGWQQRRGAAALASLRPGAVEATGFRVEFAGARKGYMGLAHLDQRRIEVFVRSCDVQSDELLRHVVAHELGHAFDTVRMSPSSRAAWSAARGFAGRNWYGCSGCTDFATPAGDFAEVFAQWARGAGSNKSEIGGDASPAELADLASRFFG